MNDVICCSVAEQMGKDVIRSESHGVGNDRHIALVSATAEPPRVGHAAYAMGNSGSDAPSDASDSLQMLHVLHDIGSRLRDICIMSIWPVHKSPSTLAKVPISLWQARPSLLSKQKASIVDLFSCFWRCYQPEPNR